MSVWNTIRQNFKDLMEVQIVNDVTNLFRETPSGLDLKKLPSSIFNGAYSIASNGLSAMYMEVNDIGEYEYQVKLQLGFVINMESKNDPDTGEIDSTKNEYNNALNDIEAIIRKRMTASTFSGVFNNVEFRSATGLEFLDGVQNFATCDLIFVVRGQRTFS